MDTPKYLYHYTNIESLACILSNRSIRFSPLDKMDDLQEKETGDLKNLGPLCYISSWTEDADEQIPMWKMYTDPKQGVRIRMPSLPFETYPIASDEIEEYFPFIERIGFPSSIYAEMKVAVHDNYLPLNIVPNLLLKKVEYTNEKSKLYPTMLIDDGKTYTVPLHILGRYKNEYWDFQQEWRYIMIVLPFDFSKRNNGMEISRVIAQMKKGTIKPVFPYYMMKLAKESFEQMEITLSPQISVGNRIIVHNLIKEFNKCATIKESNLLNLI